MINYKLEVDIKTKSENNTKYVGLFETMEYIQMNSKKITKELKKKYGKGKYQLRAINVNTKEEILID